MADRIVVMHDGLIEQIGTPLELFDQPCNLFVARFIGSPAMNVFPGSFHAGGVEALDARGPVPALALSASAGRAVQHGIRPSDLALASTGVAARVIVIEPTGAESELLVDVNGQQLTLVMHGRTDVKPE